MTDSGLHDIFHVVYHLIRLALILPVATASTEMCLYAMETVKNISRARNGGQFMNDYLIYYVEMGALETITNEVVIDRLHKKS